MSTASCDNGPEGAPSPQMLKHIEKRRIRRTLAICSEDVYPDRAGLPSKWKLKRKYFHAWLSLMTSLFDKETP